VTFRTRISTSIRREHCGVTTITDEQNSARALGKDR